MSRSKSRTRPVINVHSRDRYRPALFEVIPDYGREAFRDYGSPAASTPLSPLPGRDQESLFFPADYLNGEPPVEFR